MANAWHMTAARRNILGESSNAEEVEQEAELIEAPLTAILDSHNTPVRVTAHCKGWWTPEVSAKRKAYSKTR